MRKLKYGILTLLVMWSGLSFSQTAADANLYFESGDYQLAGEAYQNLLRTKSRDAALYNYRLAYSAYMLKDKDTAIENFKKAALKYPKSNFYLGEIYFENYNFQESADAFTSYLENPEKGDSLLENVENKLKKAELGARFINRVEDVKIVDSIVVDKNDFIRRMNFSKELGSLSQSAVYTETETKIQTTYTTQRGDRQYSSKLVEEQFDLFTNYKLLDDWTAPTALRELNTAANENFPFLMLDGVTLYFASDGEESMGGYDIFITRLNTSDHLFLKPENIGMPFNSPYNDYMMLVDELNKIGWFVSDRFLPQDKVAIYRFIPNAEKKIIRTEELDSLIRKAQVREFSTLESEQTNFQPNTDTKVGALNKIFIHDKLFYSDATDFKSNVARNFYFQLEKLKEEAAVSQKELDLLRESYYNASNANKKSDLGNKILDLEARMRKIKPQIKKLSIEMRNEEIKSLN